VIGDDGSERDHDYVSPEATTPKVLISLYELGPDTHPPPGVQLGTAVPDPKPVQDETIYPPEAQMVRYTTGTSEFRMEIAPITTVSFCAAPSTTASPTRMPRVFVADADAQTPSWESAGEWYTAGSNTFYHSFPERELGPLDPVVMSSNRRFREEEFLVAPAPLAWAQSTPASFRSPSGRAAAVARTAGPGNRLVRNPLCGLFLGRTKPGRPAWRIAFSTSPPIAERLGAWRLANYP
jgi:hypothetical protein